MPEKDPHLRALSLEMKWLEDLINLRIKTYFKTEQNLPQFESLRPPEIPSDSRYNELLVNARCTWLDRLILAVALAPFIRPQTLDSFFIKNKNLDRGFSEFGGIRGENHGGFIPTIETVAFLYGADDLEKRMHVRKCLDFDGPLRVQSILKLGRVPIGESDMSRQLFVDDHWVEYLLSGGEYVPEMSHEFPAKRITTQLSWNDLILDEDVMAQILEINEWMKHQQLLLKDWDLSKKLKRGFRCMFYGPPGTGKTLTATLLGKELDRSVYRVDLSLIVSKYIGETEKNLAKVFDLAESKNWILFFDEADALFGKRVQTSSSNDRHANQEIAFLLQRVEDFDGLVILATNFKGNLDEAFARRFQSMIYFPAPEKAERLALWRSYFNGKLPVDENIKFEDLAVEYDLTGGNIVNVLRYASIKAAGYEPKMVQEKDIQEGIRRELKQVGRSV